MVQSFSASQRRCGLMEADLDMIPTDDPEIKRNLTVNSVVVDFECATDHLLCYFSSWMRLKD